MKESKMEMKEESSPENHPGNEPVRILFLEDEPTDYDLMTRKLRSNKIKFESICVDSEHDFEKQLLEFKPDLVLSDFSLPSYDGFKALEAIGNLAPEIPFILVTGTLNEARAFEAVKKGATDFVLKDNLERLPISVNRALNETREKRKLQQAQQHAVSFFRRRQQPTPLVELNSRPIKILLLEDEPSDVLLLQKQLTGQIVYELEQADDEASYRAALKNADPDIIIADFALPTFSGLAALEIRDQMRPETPFIFLSGVIGEHVAIEAVKCGATDYVMKDNLYALPLAISRAVRETSERRLRLEAEKNLAFNQLSRIITDNTAAAVFLLNDEQKIQFANKSAEKLTNFTFSEMEGKSLHEVIHSRRADGSEFPIHDCSLHRPTARPHPLRTWDDIFVRKNGQLFNAIYSSTPIFNMGQYTGSVVELIDITNERETQQFSQSLLQINDELQQLAQVVSHELQEPVGKIRSYLGLLSTRYRDRLGADADNFIDICVMSAATISLMVDDLWTYARINKLDLGLSYVDTGKIAASAIEELRNKINATGATVMCDELPVVFGNDKQIAYLMRSLIDNALKFHGPQPPVVRITAREDGAKWIFCVKDNGVGIDKIYSKDVFRLFHRLNAKPGTSGTGMGLAICKKIVEREQGDIWFESSPGQGCAFYFSLPSSPRCPLPPKMTAQRTDAVSSFQQMS